MRNEEEIFALALLDYADESCGTVDDIGYHGYVKSPAKDLPEELQKLFDVMSEGARERWERAKTAIIRQNHLGQIYWAHYSSNAEAEWKGIEQRYDRYFEE